MSTTRAPRQLAALASLLALVGLLLNALATAGSAAPALPADPGAGGPRAVQDFEYDAGPVVIAHGTSTYLEQLAGHVWVPSDAGPNPVVVLLHGNHETCSLADGSADRYGYVFPCPRTELSRPVPSYRGYDDVAAALASHGFVVVSVDASGANAWHTPVSTPDGGADGRVQLLAKTLDLVGTWNSTPTSKVFGRADLSRIGLMGHSRGGEAVARFVSYNRERLDGPRYPGLEAVLAIAPTDFVGQAPAGVPYGVVLPGCDGDVFDLSGTRAFEEGRLAETASTSTRRVQWVVHGANHNYFNSVWSSGPDADDAYYSGDPSPTCRTSSSSRLGASDQYAVGRTLTAAFFRVLLREEQQFDGLLTGAAGLPTAACPASAGCGDVLTTTHLAPLAQHRSVTDLTGADPANVAAGGAAISATGFSEYRACDPRPELSVAGATVLETDQPCAAGTTNRSWTPQLLLRWAGPASWTAPLTAGTAAGPDSGALHVRVLANLPDALTAGAADFDVTLTDRSGASATVRAGQVSNAVRGWEEWTEPDGTPNLVLGDVRIPLGLFGGVDPHQLAALRLDFGAASPTGSLQLGGISFQP